MAAKMWAILSKASFSSIPKMDITFIFILITICLALLFDFLNGFHDAANSIATIVSTRVLKPQWAVLWAAFFNFIAFIFFHLQVAKTIGTGLVDPSVITVQVIFAALIGAIFWNLLTWYVGLPSSSSHALIGGILGASIAKAGFGHLNMAGISKVIAAIVISPALGLILGLFFTFLISYLFHRSTPRKIDRWFRKLQLISSALISLGHGGNDAQKTMGIIAILLFSAGRLGTTFYVPMWVIITCNFVIALGTFFGGWRIVRTMGMKITKLRPVSGFCAETSSAFTLFLATALGIPVSTTHTITGSIIGSGSLHRHQAVRWGVAKNIVWAWILTIPAAGLVSAAVWLILNASIL
jgi:inorganic phosphate transporter, PiT family